MASFIDGIQEDLRRRAIVLPPLVDVRSVSTDDVRIALGIKKDADEKMVTAYLFKHTPLQTSFDVNLTCLVPTEGNPEVGRPERLDLHQVLFYFLHFRLEVVTKRLEHELAGDPRRTSIASDDGEVEYTAEDFIVDEANVVIVSRDDLVKRQKEVKGDGVAYTSRIVEIPASTGYGEPIQRFFKLKDGERIVGAMSLDERGIGNITAKKEGAEPPCTRLR